MKKLFVFVVISGFLLSCTPTYLPTAPHTPIFSNKGELQVRLNLGTSGFDPQVSYAVTEHIGVMANGSLWNEKDPNTGDVKKHQFIELGGGLYNNINGRFVLEVFAGYGGGNYNGFFSSTTNTSYNSNASIQKIFLQPAVGLVTDIFDASLGARFSGINLVPEIETDKITSSIFFEPVLSLGVGYKYVKLHSQLGFSLPTTNEAQLAYQYQPFIFNISLVGRIGRKYF